MHNSDKLFVVDDDKVILGYLKGFFTKAGWDTEVFYSASAMLERIEEEKPKLIITDLDMPEMDGIDLINHLKQSTDFDNIPVLVMTALHENHVRFQSFKAGAIYFVNKPINPYELETVVRSVLSQYSKAVPESTVEPEERNAKKNAVETWVAEATDVVMENLCNEDFSLDELARALNYSRSAVQKRIKQFTGLSVSKFIRSVRLEQSLVHMLDSENSISKIAALVGFKSHSYYTRCFKDYYGIDPVKKRKELQRSAISA
jgi:YesN/AraC family two-component response regulator